MDSLALSLLPVHYESDEWGSFLIAPPTVKQAYLFYSLAPHYKTQSFANRIESIIEEWLGANPIWEFIKDYLLETKIAIATQIIQASEPEIEEKDAGKQEWIKDHDLSSMIAEYRHIFHCDPLKESWPYFLALAQCIPQLKGEMGLANLAWYAGAKSETALNSLMKSAGYYRPGTKVEDEEIEKQQADAQQQIDNASAIAEMAKLYQDTYYQ